jgi:capsid assembly protease
MKPVLSQFNQTPILIDPRQLSALENLNSTSVKEKISAQQLAIYTGVSPTTEVKPYKFVDGIAIITVYGALMHNIGWSSRYYTGYDVIRAKCKFAMTDPDVKGVLMKFHTPGGGAMGCPDTGDMIHELGKIKPVWTLSDDMAYSAGEWLHAQGTRRLVTQSGGLGSVGVVIAHVDVSKALDDIGYKISLIHAGEHKVDGNPYQKLPTAVKEKLQSECESTRERFAQAVSRGTGMSLDDVLATEAECYTGQDAVDIGFADEVVSSNTILDEFIESVKSTSIVTLGNTMTQTTEATVPTQAAAAQSPEQDAAAPVSNANAQSTERSRIKAITGCEEAKGREKLASYIAFDTEMSAEAAKAMLANAPVDVQQKAPSASDAFAQAMNAEEHPNLSADSEEESLDSNSDGAQAAAILADFKAATGIK